MPEDMVKTSERTGQIPDDLVVDLHDLRVAVQDLGKLMKKFGKRKLGEVGEELEEQSEELVRQGRHAIQVLEQRVVQLEKSVAHSVREHPGAWAGGLLGVIGFGLILGMIMRRNH